MAFENYVFGVYGVHKGRVSDISPIVVVTCLSVKKFLQAIKHSVVHTSQA